MPFSVPRKSLSEQSSLDAASPPRHAAWLEYSPATRSPRLDPGHVAFRPFRDLGLNILGEDHLKGSFTAGTPCSPTHLVWMVARGRVSMDFGDGPRPMAPGQLAICPALHPHWVRLVSKSAKGLWFHFLRLPRWRHLSGSGPVIRQAAHADELEWLLDHCLAECVSPAPGARQNALHYAEILAVVLQRELAGPGTPWDTKEQITRLEIAMEKVAAEPGTRWTVTKLSLVAGISSRELHRLCAKLYGIGPMGLVTRLRMDRAMEMLHSTNRKIEDIAAESGYSSAHAFSEAFLKHVGKRPGGFRMATTEHAHGS